MKNMRVSAKLVLSFLIVVALAGTIGLVGVIGIRTMDDVSSDMYTNKAMPLGDLTIATEYFQRIRVQSLNLVVYTGDTEQLKTVETDIRQRMQMFKDSMDAYYLTLAEDGKRIFESLMDHYNKTFEPGVLEVLDGSKKGEPSEHLLEELSGINGAADAIAAGLTELVSSRMGVMSDANDAGTRQGTVMLVIILAVIAAAVLISMILAGYISRIISKPAVFMKDVLLRIGTKGDLQFSAEEYRQIEEYARGKDEIGESVNMLLTTVRRLVTVGKALETIADGDLTGELKLLSERDTMGLSLKKMSENLNQMFSEINQATAQVASGSKQIADGSQSLAQGSTEQAAAVEQLSSSIAEIAHKTKDNADLANQAAKLAGIIKDNAEKGSRQMSEMMSAVKEINEASQNISKVIKTIDDIAFQTNILALNAAVEAARAGQHGKGFAVVAEEVRSLAAKSAEAAKDTGVLIANSMEKAGLGTRIADETAASLADIVTGINESSQLVSNIAASSDEQSAGITQINKGIDQVAQVIQQNSATAEESAAASEEMSGQSDMLQGLVAQFKLKDDSGRDIRGLTTQKKLVMPDKKYEPSSNGFGKY